MGAETARERRLVQEGSACDLGQAAAKGNARGYLDFADRHFYAHACIQLVALPGLYMRAHSCDHVALPWASE